MTWTEIQADPAYGFTVVGLIVVFGPVIAEKLRLPGLLVGRALIGNGGARFTDFYAQASCTAGRAAFITG